MFDFHKDKRRYFDIQYRTAAEYILPYILDHHSLREQSSILEIGCGEAGVLKAFRERGHHCTGIEMSQSRMQMAQEFHNELQLPGTVSFLNKDIFDIDVERDIGHRFDLVILKDVIEHIPDQQHFIPRLHEYLREGGVVFFGFPPWQMPFGGHQQICQSGVMSKLPYLHLLPERIYDQLLKWAGESDRTRRDLLDIKATGISIERFEHILGKSSFRIIDRKMWLLNPIYKYKFGKRPTEQSVLIEGIPYIRDFLTSAVYYLVG